MSTAQIRSTGDSTSMRHDTETPEKPQEIDLVVDLGRASERTRGSYTGFIIEPGAFPLRDF